MQGARKPRPFPKGRQADAAAGEALAALLAGTPRRRDLLVEHLHRIQDRLGHIPARHLQALAEMLHLSMAEVFEVATFYDRFDIVDEQRGERAPPPLTVRVCDGLPCALAGADALARSLGEAVDAAMVRVLRAPCMGRCAEAPAAAVGERCITPAGAETMLAAAEAGETEPALPDWRGLERYGEAGGYRLLEEVRGGARSIENVLAELEASGLRGLGGAGFPAARKWQAVRARPRPRLLTVNADESEPGTFKDRHILETDPHRMLEGALVAAHVIEAERMVVYLRDEYAAARAILTREIAALGRAGLVAPDFIDLRRGAGAYICGEESAMVESIEGKRGWPRHRPPYLAERGLDGRPTLNHNVETLAWVPRILAEGGARFAARGVRGARGLRSFSVSGRVARPGLIEAPAGSTARELIARAGGMAEGHALRAFLPGGASGGILPAELADTPLDFGTLEAHGGAIGSHALIVLSDRDDLLDAAHNLLAFFARESCGQCTPCRVGCEKAVQMLDAARSGATLDRALLAALCDAMADASICGLGQAAPNPIRSLLRHFPEALP